MQMEYNKIQKAVDRMFDASPLAVNFVQKLSTHGRVAPAPHVTRDKQWLPKQASTGLFKVGRNSRPPLLKASGRPSVSYMDMFGKKANKSSDSSFELVAKTDKSLSPKKQAEVLPQTSTGVHVERKKRSDPCIPRETTTAELDRLPGTYSLRTRGRVVVDGASVHEAADKSEKSGPVESSLIKVTEQNEGLQNDDVLESLSNQGEVETERSSGEEEDLPSNQPDIDSTVKLSLDTVTEQHDQSQDDDDVNSLSNQGELETERSSDEEEGDLRTTNLQSDAQKIDNRRVVKQQLKSVQSAAKPTLKQNTVPNTSHTKSQPSKKDPEQKHSSLTVLRLIEPVDTPKTVRGTQSRENRRRGPETGLERSQLVKTTKSSSLKSINDSLNRRVRGKGKRKKISDLKGTENDPLAFSDLPTTRSGRTVKPPLAWWAGQRVFVHPHADIVEIKPPTPSSERDSLSASMIHFREDMELERSKRCMSRSLLSGYQKNKASLKRSDNLKKKSLMKGSSLQTCRQVTASAQHQDNDNDSGDDSQSSQHSVRTPLSRSMPLYKSDGEFSEKDVLEKFDTPGLPKHLRNPPAASRSRLGRFTARTLEVEDPEGDDLCRSFGSTPVGQLMKRRVVEERKRQNRVTEVEEETLLKKTHQRKLKAQTADDSDEEAIEELSSKLLSKSQRSNQRHNADCSEPKSKRGHSRKDVTKETISNKLTNVKRNHTASSQSSCSDEETIEELSPKPLSKYQRSNQRSDADCSKKGRGRPRKQVNAKTVSRKTQEENVKQKVNSKPYRKVASQVIEDVSSDDDWNEPRRRQRGKVISSNQRKTAKATKALKTVDNKPLEKERKSRGQTKKQVYPADVNSTAEPQVPSKIKAKIFKNKENINIRSSADSMEDTWDSEEITLYKQALRQLNPSMDNFWYHVQLLVETKTAQQCQAYHQRCAPASVQKKKPPPPPKADNGQKPSLTGKTGTLKRKRELKNMIEELNHNHEDDFFDATPVRQAKRLRLPTQDDEDDDDFYQNRPNTETPLNNRFTTPNPRLTWMPTSKTPVSSLLSPSLTNTVDRKNTETYVHRLLTKRPKRLPAVDNIEEEQEASQPETPKASGTPVYQTLFKKDTPQEEDSEVEEDYYFSDSN